MVSGSNAGTPCSCALTSRAAHVDVAAAMDEQPRSRAVSLKMVSDPGVAPGAPPADDDPFAGIEVS